ncbi:Rho guanyl nucleotide exchange factor [Grosmannia clavigera kw1407]|uniref:Rho guanyl nucleotide exchange factor n=1 Tax=Grosmannia clavigera (strain kw1407 / UAMH 11150) TaxID=655863 RepID=F0XHD9_GROCL|nr:Rho guanyl nucleotide exchange factor [Grosmannia clavigera kw1407]EFX02894.1 Rho guanyl nucleotide exchange factor [Grosmannia clavigera kw1407]
MDRSRRQTLRSSLVPSRTDRSSRASAYGRQSEDSHDRHSQVDLATIERSLNRRRVIEELIRTEEGYIGDVRFLMNMNQFFIYEEYGAQYELMFKDLHAAYRSVAKWDEYQKGLETLGSCIGSTNQSQNSRRALTISDLLTKRVCRYPLLFSELVRYTPVCDCPYSYMEIENTLARLREVTGAMNRAADSVLVRATLKKTWLLQDRLAFPNQEKASNAKEEWEWRRRLERNMVDDGHTQPEAQDLSFLALDIRTLGTVFGKPGTAARKLSIRRATTVGPKSPLCQVIVKNTSFDKDNLAMPPRQAPINRSQSLQANARIPVLSPPRSDRARLEALICDVWTRDVLSFPGTTTRTKPERPALSSASSAMRKLSVASLTSTFGRRSMGRANTHKRAASFDVGASETYVPSWPLNRMHTDGVYENEQPAGEGQRTDNDTPTVGHASSMMNFAWPRPEIEPSSPMHTVPTNYISRSEPSETSAMAGSIKRTMSRFFEDGWQHQPQEAQGAQISDGNSNGGYQSRDMPPIIRAAYSEQSLRSVQSTGLKASHANSTSRLSTYASVHENQHQPTKQSSIRSLRRWSKTNVFHRTSLSQSFRGLLH